MTTSKKRKKKVKEPLKDERGWWVVGPFVAIVSAHKDKSAYTEQDTWLYGLDRDGQVWCFHPDKQRWAKVSHVRVDSPHPPPPPMTPQDRRNAIEEVRKLQGPQAAADFEAEIRSRGFEIAEPVS